MEKLVEEIKKLIPTKAQTEIGDIVLIMAKELQMPLFARVTGIERDESRSDEWWHVHLAVFSIPLQHIAWTLRMPQMTGAEIFTMGGEPRFMQAIDFSASPLPAVLSTEKPLEKRSGLKRVK